MVVQRSGSGSLRSVQAAPRREDAQPSRPTVAPNFPTGLGKMQGHQSACTTSVQSHYCCPPSNSAIASQPWTIILDDVAMHVRKPRFRFPPRRFFLRRCLRTLGPAFRRRPGQRYDRSFRTPRHRALGFAGIRQTYGVVASCSSEELPRESQSHPTPFFLTAIPELIPRENRSFPDRGEAGVNSSDPDRHAINGRPGARPRNRGPGRLLGSPCRIGRRWPAGRRSRAGC